MNRWLIALVVVCGCRSPRQPEAATGAHLRILTYNVNWGASRPELAANIIQQ